MEVFARLRFPAINESNLRKRASLQENSEAKNSQKRAVELPKNSPKFGVELSVRCRKLNQNDEVAIELDLNHEVFCNSSQIGIGARITLAIIPEGLNGKYLPI